MSNQDLAIAALYPQLTPEEQAEAAYNLGRYVEVMVELAKEVDLTVLEDH